MKKTFFKALRAMCVGALTLAAVSCYDDSALREDFRDLEDEVESLVERLEALESNLNSDASNVGNIEAAVAALEKSFNEAMQANSAEVQKSFDQKLADLKAELEAAVAAGDKENADALAKEKEALEAAMQTLQTSLQDGLAAVTGSVEELEAAIKALEVVVGANYKALLAEMDKKDGVLDGEISNLEAIVDSLKTADKALEAEIVAALAKISVIKATEVDGKVVITFADGSEVELSKPLANVDNNGLVTIVEENGVKYWQIVGEAAHTGITVGADIEFMVSKENGELFYRVNGGEWVTTGVKAEASDAGAVILTAFEDGEDYVKLTIGGVEVVLPKYADLGAAQLSRSEAYFVYGKSKTVAVEAEGECYVMNKPDGWKANLVDGVLTVTAPAAELVNSGVADAEGQVLVHVNTPGGACTVLKLNVTVGAGLVLGYNDGVISYFNANAGLQTNWWGDSWYDFTDVWFGILTIDEFAEYGSIEAYMATQPEPLGGFQTTLQNIFQIAYEEGVCEAFEAEISLEDLVAESWCGYELEEGQTYVLWAVPAGSSSNPWIYDEVAYVVTNSYVAFEAGEPTYNNVAFQAAFFGADGFAVGATSKTAFDDWGVDGVEYTYEMALEEFLMGSWQPGPLMNFNDGDRSAMGKVYGTGSYTVNLKDVLLPDYGQVPPVDPNTEYFVWVLPYSAGKELYTMEDLILTVVKTADLTYNPDLAATVTFDEVTASSITFTVVPPTGGSTRYELMTAEDFESFMNDGALDVAEVANYLKWNWAIDEPCTEEYGSWMIESSTTYYLISYTTAEGQYSVSYASVTTPVAVEYPTPAGKQWVAYNPSFVQFMEFPETNMVIDLGVAFPTLYPDYYPDPNTLVIGIDYEPIYGPEAAGQWMTTGISGSYTIEATDETSGVIYIWGAPIPYSNLTETTCEFDLAVFAYSDEPMIDVYTLAEEFIAVQGQ